MSRLMNGISVKNDSEARTGGRGQEQIKVSSVEIRYANGDSFTFVPESNGEFFGQDELLMLADRLLKSSQVMEWTETNTKLSM